MTKYTLGPLKRSDDLIMMNLCVSKVEWHYFLHVTQKKRVYEYTLARLFSVYREKKINIYIMCYRIING